MPANRDKAGRFVKGVSGNPTGRRKLPAGVREALQDMVPDAVDLKRRILTDQDAPLDLRNKVADSVLDRVYGRPGSAVPEEGTEAMAKLDQLIEGITDAAKR